MSLRRLGIVAGAVAGLGVMLAPPASALDNLGLDEVLEAVRLEPELVRQIGAELRKSDIKVGEIMCVADRHGSQWKFLGGGSAAPYACRIGDRTLRIDAVRTYFDVNGRKLGQQGQISDAVLFSRAKSFRESPIRWSWGQ